MLNTIPPDPDRERRDIEHLMEYLRVSTDGPSGLSREEAMAKYIKEVMPTAVPPPKSLPCANVKVEAYEACDKPGTRACSACKLVSYCSKVGGLVLAGDRIADRCPAGVPARTLEEAQDW